MIGIYIEIALSSLSWSNNESKKYQTIRSTARHMSVSFQGLIRYEKNIYDILDKSNLQ